MKHRVLLWAFLGIGVLGAHPMGNFSVSHYSLIRVTARGADIRYVLDLAEIPTFQLLQGWKLEAGSPRQEIERQVTAQAREWVRNLKIEAGGHSLTPTFERASMTMDQGAGNMPILRVTTELHVPAVPGRLQFADNNFPDRAGWKEIVTVAGKDAALDRAEPGLPDRSQALTAYPQDPQLAPPQDLRATIEWHSTAAPVETRPVTASPAAEPAPAPPVTVPTPVPQAAQPGQNAPGMVVRGDFLSRLLNQGEITWSMMLIGLAVAFGLGAIHALSPGHGKTIVAAYLVGSRGTPRHALLLGGMVTFTHTISVFSLGLATYFLSRYILPEKIYPVLGAISGLSIVWIGATLLLRRARLAIGKGPTTHAHAMPEGEISMGSLMALGASGGLVPCPSALVLLLSSVALGRIALGLTLLVSFSAGLAVVLSGIGLVVLYAKHLLPDNRKNATNMAFRYLPVASAAIIVCAGIVMTGVALGVIRPFAGV